MGLAALFAVLVLFLFHIAGFSGQQPFKSDGCSMVPDFDFRDCCVIHDRAYWRGGTEAERLTADQAFHQCMITKDHPIIAPLYTQGVRVFGTPHLPTFFRWGFGKDYPAGYEAE